MDRPTTAPGAERILHLGTTLEVFLAELRPTPGRLQATVRATIAVMVGVVLAAMVGDPAFVMCPVTAMTESTPGAVHSPGLLARRVLLSFLCAGASIVIVAAFPQAQPVLYVAILLLVFGDVGSPFGDYDGDGIITTADLSMLLMNFGPVP